MSDTNPLHRLLVSDSQAVNHQELADLLLPYLSINKDSKNFDFSADFRNLSNIDKILILLSGIKAKHLILETEDKVTPSEIIKMEVAPAGSVKNTLKTLLDTGEIKAEKGRYFLPNYRLSHVINKFRNINF